MDRNTRFVASAHPPHTLRVTPEKCPSRHLFEAMLSKNTVITAREYHNNDATQIKETGTLPSNKSIKLLAMQAATPVTPENMYRAPRKKHRNIRRIIRRMEKIRRKAKYPHIIAPFHPPTRNPDPAVFGNDLKSSLMSSRGLDFFARL